MFHDSIIAAIRTGVAAIVVTVISLFIRNGIEIDDTLAGSLTVALTGLGIAAYNWLVIVLEKKVDPRFGFLLGIPKTPSYNG